MFAVLLCAVSLPIAASAADLDYSYIEGGFSQNHLTGVDGGNGYTVTGSLDLPLGFLVDASLDHAHFDTHIYLGNASMQRHTVHAGWHVGVMDSVALVFRVGATHLDSSNSGNSYTYTAGSYDLNVGVRAQLPAGFELEAGLGSDDAAFVYAPATVGSPAFLAPDKSTETYETAALRYHILDNLLLGLSYENRSSRPFAGTTDSTMHTWLLAARWAF